MSPLHQISSDLQISRICGVDTILSKKSTKTETEHPGRSAQHSPPLPTPPVGFAGIIAFFGKTYSDSSLMKQHRWSEKNNVAADLGLDRIKQATHFTILEFLYILNKAKHRLTITVFVRFLHLSIPVSVLGAGAFMRSV